MDFITSLVAACLLVSVSSDPAILQRDHYAQAALSPADAALSDTPRFTFDSSAPASVTGAQQALSGLFLSPSSNPGGSQPDRSFVLGVGAPSGSVSVDFPNAHVDGGHTKLFVEPSPSTGGAVLAPDFYDYGGITVTQENTIDVFSTLTNVIYNTIPVTLTEFAKTTVTVPTVQVITTSVDDRVFVVTAPVTRTDTITVTDVVSNYQFQTEVSTDIFTITHVANDIKQQTVTSTLLQTQFFRPTVVRTRIVTQRDTQTVYSTVYNTLFVDSPGFSFAVLPTSSPGRASGLYSGPL